ncbi:hypothetical protein [Bradyrhizobium phage BDU-MI-1]|nr:hypothetical protein [Bradyrhizobium phage BDU-MI-1]
MTQKVASAFYSTAVSHKEMDGLWQVTWAIPGEPPHWILDTDGRPKAFRDRDEAVLAGFKCMVSRLNRARQEQDFYVKGDRPQKNPTRSWSAARENGPTVDSVFGKNGK